MTDDNQWSMIVDQRYKIGHDQWLMIKNQSLMINN